MKSFAFVVKPRKLHIFCSKEKSEMDHHGGHEMATTASNRTESSMMNHHGSGHMMMMYFHFSEKAVILFKGWSVENAGGMVASCIGIFILAALYEGLKISREILKRKYSYVVSVDMPGSKTYSNGQTVITESRGKPPRSRLCNWHHFLQTFLHMLQVTISYFLMLIFMTYNVWLCLSVVLGAGLGYFVFGWKINKVIDIYEHCH